MDFELFESRKRDHIRHALDPANQATGRNGLDRIELIHEALPELDFAELSLQSSCLGRKVATPFYVAGMTAGHQDAFAINRALALACSERGWAMGVGSQRRELESAGGGTLDAWKNLRAEVPDLILFANIGISQLINVDFSKVMHLVEELQAQALGIHVNALQEAIQPEGTPHFKGALKALARICQESKVPVMLKETGCGFSRATLERLFGMDLAAIDVSGLGGTHWGRMEGARSEGSSKHARASRTFANWGVPTAEAVVAAKEQRAQRDQRDPQRPFCEIWASGGVRSGLDAAKLIALGADRVGYAKPALEAALQGGSALRDWMELQEYELKIAMFCTGSVNLPALQRKERAWRTPNSSD